jgi:uncharacterized protein YkwD
MSVNPGRLFLFTLCLVACLVSARAEEPKEKAKFKLSMEEQRLLELTNAERKKEDLPPLVPNAVLFKVARGHSENMARQEKLAHELDGKTPYMRIKAAGYRYHYAGENVASGDVELEDVVKGWMASPGHRKNILGRNFTEIGLGLATSERGDVYYTQVFASPRKSN